MSLSRVRSWPVRWRVTSVVAALVVVAGTTAAFATTNSGSDDSRPLPGVVVPAALRQPIVQAARSCMALTPARLAGQIMEESRFAAGETNSRNGRGLAGLTDEAWNAWHPWPGADRLDPKANIAALAHYLCDMVGQARVAKAAGDTWRLAVAGHHSGPATVKASVGMPEEADKYVKRVARFTAWYERQPYFDGVPAVGNDNSGGPTTPPIAPSATATPSPRTSPSQPAVKPTKTTAAPAQTSVRPTKSTPPPGYKLVVDLYLGCVTATPFGSRIYLEVVGECPGSAAQRWEPRSDGTIRSGGLCMDIENASMENFAGVLMAPCNGTSTQKFYFNGKKQIYSPYASKCANVHDLWGRSLVLLFPCLDQGNQYFRQVR
ncbi:ricin-type beta-trefoil lectin domain protein [Micromonospora polyrhachis]|uniref:Ricin B lectin domain-containing protein n=1 Tax=Micromonospora polyrhachis TaxID=1282883 RepID=A0A7W7WQ38_9ACTN|nr:ricin-type beta-trefoil lectin domain protein [Micromonospora polyrhachis]MBB4959072.1 hypothetical protein [Micromonospora polyrhachis]